VNRDQRGMKEESFWSFWIKNSKIFIDESSDLSLMKIASIYVF